MLLQGVVNSEGKFIHVSTGYPGSIHDSRMLRISSLCKAIEDKKVLCAPSKICNGKAIKPLLLGDPAYKLTTWLMKPYPQTGVLSESQKTFNYSFSSLRVVVEQAFGKLKGQWRCLLGCLNEDTQEVSTTIIAYCVLHNICTEMGDDTPIAIVQNNVGALPAAGHHINADGRQLREHIKNYLC